MLSVTQDLATATDTPDLLELFQKLRHGEFEAAAHVLRKGAGTRAAIDYVEMLGDVVQRKPQSAEAWAAQRDRVLARSSGENRLSAMPFADPAQVTDILETCDRVGVVAPVGVSFSVVTAGASDSSSLRCRLPATGHGHLVSILLEAHSHVNGNFAVYFERQDGSYERLLSIHQGGFTVGDQIVYVSPTYRVPLLWTFVAEPERLEIYLNGTLCLRRRHAPAAAPQALRLSLIGVEGQTDSVYCYGLDFTTLARPFEGLLELEDARYEGLARFLLREGRVRELWILRQAIDDIELDGMEKEKLALLDTLVRSDHGFAEWIYNDVRETLGVGQVAPPPPKPVIAIEGVTVMFSSRPGEEFSLSRIMSGRKLEQFAVLNDIAMRIFPGDVVGIIGRNGAGKTTLLRAIVGALPITTGRIVLHGRAMLLRPGIGMRDELTGRENILCAGLYMGLSRAEIADILDEVIDFSELGEAIDRPIRYYSDGMRSRLIFSLATASTPEILLLDELLSAGDIGFRDKAARRLEKFMGKAKAVLVVTHGLGWVREKCNKALFLSDGRIGYFGDAETACDRYLRELHQRYGHQPGVSLDDEEGELLTGSP